MLRNKMATDSAIKIKVKLLNQTSGNQ